MWEKLDEKKISFSLPSENLAQILPEFGSGSALDPHITNADPKHCSIKFSFI
jgi:hypothetical protein